MNYLMIMIPERGRKLHPVRLSKARSKVNKVFLTRYMACEQKTLQKYYKSGERGRAYKVPIGLLNRNFARVDEIRYPVKTGDTLPETDEKGNHKICARCKGSGNVPERFDLLNPSFLVSDIQTAKTARVNPVLIKHMEMELTRKKYKADPSVARELECVFELDPLYGYEQQDKMTMLSNGGITERDYIVSCNIAQFVQRAFKADEHFNQKSYEEKKKVISGYADEIIIDKRL
jgi:hypothetical protein